MPSPRSFVCACYATVEEALQALTKIDADYLTHQDQKRLALGDRPATGAGDAANPGVDATGVGNEALHAREAWYSYISVGRGRIMHSDLRRVLHHYRINSAALSAAVATLVRAGIVCEHRELARNWASEDDLQRGPQAPER